MIYNRILIVIGAAIVCSPRSAGPSSRPSPTTPTMNRRADGGSTKELASHWLTSCSLPTALPPMPDEARPRRPRRATTHGDHGGGHGHHTSLGLSNNKLAMWLFLGSECLLFGG